MRIWLKTFLAKSEQILTLCMLFHKAIITIVIYHKMQENSFKVRNYFQFFVFFLPMELHNQHPDSADFRREDISKSVGYDTKMHFTKQYHNS